MEAFPFYLPPLPLCIMCIVSHFLHVATLIVEITTSGGDTVAGEQYTLTCTVTVPESSGLSGTPTVGWTGGEGKTGVTEGTAETSGRVTTVTLTFDPLQDSQDGVYTCSTTLPVSGMDSATGMDVFTLDVVGMSLCYAGIRCAMQVCVSTNGIYSTCKYSRTFSVLSRHHIVTPA